MVGDTLSSCSSGIHRPCRTGATSAEGIISIYCDGSSPFAHACFAASIASCRSMYSSIPVTVHFQIIITEFFCWTDSAFLSAISIWYAGKSTVFYHCDSILRIKPIKLSLPRFIVLIRFFCPPYLNAHKIRTLTRICVQSHRFCLSSCFRKNHRGYKLSLLPHNPRFTFSHYRHRPFVHRRSRNHHTAYMPETSYTTPHFLFP